MTDDDYSEKIMVSTPWNYEAMMERMLHNTSIADTIIKLFLKDAPEQLKKLNNAINDENFKEIRQYSHSIKGSASNLGGEAMRSSASDMEQFALKKDLNRIKSIHPTLLAQYNELEELLIDYVENRD